MGNEYKCLSKQKFHYKHFSIIPIRFEDRYLIMKWRNEQIFHLRQHLPLTTENQDDYFKKIIHPQFQKNQPPQILFSFLFKTKCIGYGGLVHIDWRSKNAELSFVMNTSLEKINFIDNWIIFLKLIEEVSFEKLSFNKIYTKSYDVRPKLYKALKVCKFIKEGELKNHVLVEGQYKNLLIHSKINPNSNDLSVYFLREVSSDDVKKIFDWANESLVRKNSFNSKSISWAEHKKWFKKKYDSNLCFQFILTNGSQDIGQIRIDFDTSDSYWHIDYSVSKTFRGKKVGKKMILLLIDKFPFLKFKASVKKKNIASIKIFRELNFIEENKDTYFNFTLHENS